MKKSTSTTSTIYRVLLLTIILYGLYHSFFVPIEVDIPLLPSIAYFTTQSNIMVALALIIFLLQGQATSRLRTIIRGGILLYIIITGLVFHSLLVPNLPEFFAEGIPFNQHITHTIAPLGFALDWLLFDEKNMMRYGDIKYWLIYPLLYWFITVVQGRFSGLYPYFFMDIGEIGLLSALLWLLALSAFFILLSLAIVRLDHLKGKRFEGIR